MDIAEQAEKFLREQDRARAKIEFQLMLLEHGAQIVVPEGG